MTLPLSRLSGVLAALLLASGCARRVPETELTAAVETPAEVTCRTLGVRFEQTGGACTPFSRTDRAFELLGKRCDDETLASAQQQLQQEAGPERVEEVVLGERVPGSDRRRVVVRYASATPGTCPLDPKAGVADCPDCQVGKVLVSINPLRCPSLPLHNSIIEVVKETAQTCSAEELDSARARVLALGNLSNAEVLCTTETDDGLRRVLVFAHWSRAVCSDRPPKPYNAGARLLPGEPPPKQLTCSRGVVSGLGPGGGTTEYSCR